MGDLLYLVLRIWLMLGRICKYVWIHFAGAVRGNLEKLEVIDESATLKLKLIQSNLRSYLDRPLDFFNKWVG